MDENLKIPVHVAIILDGNGRWAKSKGLPRNMGHVQGAKNVEVICEAAYNMGIKYVTMYAFSTENWNRPDDEVAALMKLLRSYLKTCRNLSQKNNMRVRVIGDKSGLDKDLQETIADLEDFSKDMTGLNFQVALNYGSRDEIIRAVNALVSDVRNNKPDTEGVITEEMFERYLDTADIPDPDLLIRTSGEQRLSNYLLWQMAYTEFYFTNVYWPDFSPADLEDAVYAYNKRDRRYGGV